MNVQQYDLTGESLLRENFFEKLETNPTLDIGGCVALFEKCTAIKTMDDVWRRQATCVRMMNAYPDGHPSRGAWLNEFVALGHYEEHLNDIEAYRAETAASKCFTPDCL